ncbi:MAG: radical SAM protein [Tepidibacter sp.]|uniref:radical SAM/SPASM domain-containing protein n=1 Tax=Tepidibacter sp. TaxID=2529387 RepID=UPI0025D35E27|nr:radical SAM protein [Tepidibacter sp.]MCT4507722.1 radical SAM protein [Tepidibacter sp.]
MKYNFSENSRIIKNKDKVVLGNRENGRWVRISKEVYDILNLGIVNNCSIDELKISLYDDEDREYIGSIYKKLCFIGLIKDKNNKQVLGNKIASFEITHRCNLKCIHCCIDADGIISDKKDLTTQEIKKALDRLIEWNPERIMLSGGEPMLRKDFIEILTYLKKHYNGKIVVSTNGTLINDQNVDILAKSAYQIDISIDGVDEQTCSTVRGAGIFDKVIKSVKLLKNTGFEKITLSMVVADKNKGLEDRFNKLNEDLGTRAIIRGFSAVGRGKDNKVYFSDLGEDEVYISDKYLNNDYDKPIRMCNCSAGKRELFVSYNGDIYPCPSFIKSSYLLGNILSINKIEELPSFKNKNISEYDLLDMLNLKNYNNCKKCKVNLFCWTCPGSLEGLKDNKLGIENKCKKIKPVLYKRVWGERI